MKNINGWGKTWNAGHVPECIKTLNRNPIGVKYTINGYRFSKHLKLKNSEIEIDVLFEIFEGGGLRMYTNNLKYGPMQEINFDKKNQCFTIKNLDKLRVEWRKNHPEDTIDDNVLDVFIEAEV